jgi:hypothetical protein
LPWYYGVDGNEGINAVELLPVVIHELGHGLGFSTSTIAGVEEVFPSIYDWFLYDDTQGMHWPDMTEAQRAASAQNCSNLAWDGASVMAAAPARLGPKPLLRVNSPSMIAADMSVGLASFGPPLEEAGVTGDVVLVNDGAGVPTNGCEPFTNAAAIAGKIALVDRGGCTFVTKVRNAQAAGAIAVVVADSVPGCPALGMGGASDDITIPAVRITQDDGARIKSQLLLGTVNATLISDPALHAGADAAGRVLMFSPLPYQTGSSVSHWDTSAYPDLLMEPALNQGLSTDVDLTRSAFRDIGWEGSALSVPAATPRPGALQQSFPNPAAGTTTLAYTLSRAEPVALTIVDAGGRIVARFDEPRAQQGRHFVKWNAVDYLGRSVAPGVYHYRLKTPTLDETRNLVVVR